MGGGRKDFYLFIYLFICLLCLFLWRGVKVGK